MDLEQALNKLYDASPEQFVAERKRLAAELKGAGQAADAASLAQVRKPKLAAWALNRLARDHRRDVDLLLDSGHRLRTAQAGVLRGGDRESLEEAQRTERETIARLVCEAERTLAGRGGASAAVLDQIAASLRAAAISEQGRELLATGRFTEPLANEGFDVLAGLAPPRPARPAKPARSAEQKRAQAAVTRARGRLRKAEEEARDAQLRAARAEAAVQAAREALRQAEERAKP